MVLGLAIAGAALAGCGKSPSEQYQQIVDSGNFRVLASNRFGALGEALYDNGSYKVMPAQYTSQAYFDAAEGRGWVVITDQGTIQEVDVHTLAAIDWWVPPLILGEYWDSMRAGSEGTVEISTSEGLTGRVEFAGPGGLPSYFVVMSGENVVLEAQWEYDRIGEITPEELKPPEGLQELPPDIEEE
jgi:hypothetical protein